jgi:hypothetical protein
MPPYRIPKDAIFSEEGPVDMNGGWFSGMIKKGRTRDIPLPSNEQSPRPSSGQQLGSSYDTVRKIMGGHALEGLKKAQR